MKDAIRYYDGRWQIWQSQKIHTDTCDATLYIRSLMFLCFLTTHHNIEHDVKNYVIDRPPTRKGQLIDDVRSIDRWGGGRRGSGKPSSL